MKVNHNPIIKQIVGQYLQYDLFHSKFIFLCFTLYLFLYLYLYLHLY